MALYVKKGNYIWNLETEYQGEITGENATEYIIGWYFNSKSGEGYKNETVPKNLVEDSEKRLEERVESIEAEQAASANEESEINRQFKEKLIGKRIVDISTEGCYEGFDTDEESVGCDGGKTIIKLEEGIAIECWNSEWGGLRIQKKEEEKKTTLHEK